FAVGRSTGDDETPAPADTPTVTPTTIAPTTIAPTTIAPTIETVVVVGAEGDVPITFTMPAGWKNSGWGAIKGDPFFGWTTAEVSDIYADPCHWEVVPPFGPTVDDLVLAWANVPGFDASATSDVIVDGYAGKQIEFTVPDYNEEECRERKYGIWHETEATNQGPNYWAQGPNEHHRVWILDVDGTRLVINAASFPHTSPRDRAALDAMMTSIQIG
ncbi:MAG: hypothetical protein ABWZ99_12115, partial [Ilumatobacteraceae bacterium]